ncbi:unnamed protein product, partial [Prorocentrum cordatum]
EVISVAFGSRPELRFELEQVVGRRPPIFGPLDTGGALWYADRVLSQFLVTAGPGAGPHGRPAPAGGLALVLGCGGVPLSALVAAALGWSVVMTDLEPVIELTRTNVRRAEGAVQAERDRLACTRPAEMAVRELYFGDEPALDEALSAAGAVGEGAPLLVLCSDCIWREFLHRPLLCTVAAALGKASGAAEALFCFQTRSPQNEAMFLKVLKEEFGCLETEAVDASEALSQVLWPAQVQHSVGQMRDLPKNFPLLRLTLREGAVPPRLGAPQELAAGRKPWWS